MPFFKNDDYYTTAKNITNKQIQELIQQMHNAVNAKPSATQTKINKYSIVLQPLEILFRKEEEIMGLFGIADKVLVSIHYSAVDGNVRISLTEFLQEFMPQVYEKYKLLIDEK